MDFLFSGNSSIEDLERFFGKVTGTEDEENEEEELYVSTVSSKWDPTESSKDSIDNGASFPVSLVRAIDHSGLKKVC